MTYFPSIEDERMAVVVSSEASSPEEGFCCGSVIGFVRYRAFILDIFAGCPGI